MSPEKRGSSELIKPNGVRVLMVPDSQIGDYVLGLPGVSLETTEVKDKSLTVVRIDKGDAGFVGGGSVVLRVGRQRVHRVGFSPDSVLEIQTLNGELIKRNHHMCVDCCANTGKMVDYSQSAEIVGTIDATFQCEQNPEHQWELKHI